MKIACLLLAAALCLAAGGCASQPQGGADGTGAAATGGSGITVFGTVDAAVNHTRNR